MLGAGSSLKSETSMELGKWRFNRIYNGHNNLVRDVLAYLESVILS